MLEFILTLPAWAFGVSISVVSFWVLSIGILIYSVLTAPDAPNDQE